jgi:hypothetical protein
MAQSRAVASTISQPPERLVPEEPFLIGIQAARLHLLVGGEEEASGARSWVAYPHGRSRPHHVHDRLDERTRREVRLATLRTVDRPDGGTGRVHRLDEE